ncbi:hypothetical protein V6N13_098935 [Hibiscus sabdariffa]
MGAEGAWEAGTGEEGGLVESGAFAEPLLTLEDVVVVEAGGAEASLVGRTPVNEPEAAEGVGTVMSASSTRETQPRGWKQWAVLFKGLASRLHTGASDLPPLG